MRTSLVTPSLTFGELSRPTWKIGGIAIWVIGVHRTEKFADHFVRVRAIRIGHLFDGGGEQVSATFLSLSILCMCIGGFLTMFGLSFSNHYELNIDLRTASKIVGAHDKRFWADVKRIIHEQSATTKKE